ncbi:hypothetical protein Tco_0087068 [Tanacetum coccineum]
MELPTGEVHGQQGVAPGNLDDLRIYLANGRKGRVAEDYFQWLALCFYSSWLDGPPCCWAKEFHQDRASSVKVPVANFTLQSSVQLLPRNMNSVRSNRIARASLGLRCPIVCLHLTVLQLSASRSCGNTSQHIVSSMELESWLVLLSDGPSLVFLSVHLDCSGSLRIAELEQIIEEI